jgi:CRISPR-associated protein Csc2
MSMLTEFEALFPNQIPVRPEAHYAHIVTLRITESYPIFRTDGDLNTARVSAGQTQKAGMDRIAMFMRKQTTAERLRGRELLRLHAIIGDECRYNEKPCGQCPDCVAYGYAIGDTGAEKSKVFSDTAYSLTEHAISHEVNTFNAPGESGTMYDQASGNTSNRINSTTYIKPGVVFPAVITTRDLTAQLFFYTLNNLLSTQRYGATTTRTGRIENEVIALVLSDGEIMSNLALTQAIYDSLVADNAWQSDELIDPAIVRAHAEARLPELIDRSNVSISKLLMGANLAKFLADFREQFSHQPEKLLKAAQEEARNYQSRLTTRPASAGRGRARGSSKPASE